MKKKLVNFFKISSTDFESTDLTKTLLIKSFKRGGSVYIDINDDLMTQFEFPKNLSKKTVYINPFLEDTRSINPLNSNEQTMTQDFLKSLKILNIKSDKSSKDLEEQLIRNSLKIIKKLFGEKATLSSLVDLLQDSNGKNFIISFSKLTGTSVSETKEIKEISNWFMDNYFNEKNGLYEEMLSIRSKLLNILSNEVLKKLLIPSPDNAEINIGKHLATGGNIIINLSQDTIGDLNSNYLLFNILNQLKNTLPQQDTFQKDINIYINNSERLMSDEAIQSILLGRNYEEHTLCISRVQVDFPYRKQKRKQSESKNIVNEEKPNSVNLVDTSKETMHDLLLIDDDDDDDLGCKRKH